MKWIVLFVLLSSMVLASPGPLHVLDMGYEDGQVVVYGSYDSFGYYPDRLVEEGDVRLEIVGEGGVLYTTTIDPPRVEFTEANVGGELEGGPIDAEEFALVVPSFAQEEQIVITGRAYSRSYDIGSSGNIWLPLLLVILSIGILITLLIRMTRK